MGDGRIRQLGQPGHHPGTVRFEDQPGHDGRVDPGAIGAAGSAFLEHTTRWPASGRHLVAGAQAMKTIELSQGLRAIVDDQDFELVSRIKWHAHKTKGKVYARGRVNGKRVYMHQIISGDGIREVDHRDGDGLNNSRGNLRPSSHSQNLSSMKIKRSNTSGYKGVSKTESGKWRACIAVNYKQISLGRYETAEEAARAYNIAAVMHFGEFALLNEV